MSYTVEIQNSAQRALNKLDVSTRARIIDWLETNLDGCENPRLHGKALSGNLRGKWRYRVGDYRIVAEIHDDKVLILVLEVAHRSKVYR